MKVLFPVVEVKPFSKAGGVADVAGELPPALTAQGIDVEVVTPLYDCVDRQGLEFVSEQPLDVPFAGGVERATVFRTIWRNVPTTFIKSDKYFGGVYGKPYIHSAQHPFSDDARRFEFLSEAILRLLPRRQPDIVHAHDWGFGFLFGRMAMAGLPQKRVLTIHNIGYQGNLWRQVIRGWDMEEMLSHPRIGPLFLDPRPEWNSVNPLRLAMELAHRVNTVSPTYRNEITQPEDPSRFFEGGRGLDVIARRLAEGGRLTGILNGFEYRVEPTDANLADVLSRKAASKAALLSNAPSGTPFLLGFVGRAVEQKFGLLAEPLDGKPVLNHILDMPGIHVAILATGEERYERFLRGISTHRNSSVTVAFDAAKKDQISLGCDVFLMPSVTEPCGITQMESLSCATPPLVRWVGGLVDTVRPHTHPNGTGFGFDGRHREEVLRNLVQTVHDARRLHERDSAAFARLQRRAFRERFLWSASAERYIRESL